MDTFSIIVHIVERHLSYFHLIVRIEEDRIYICKTHILSPQIPLEHLMGMEGTPEISRVLPLQACPINHTDTLAYSESRFLVDYLTARSISYQDHFFVFRLQINHLGFLLVSVLVPLQCVVHIASCRGYSPNAVDSVLLEYDLLIPLIGPTRSPSTYDAS